MTMNRREFSALLGGALVASAVDSVVPRPLHATVVPQAQSKRWNLLMITNDQHRWDCNGFMGNRVIQTAATDRLASEGAVFEQHYVQCPQCVPSRSALYTGRYPHVNLTPSNLYHLPPNANTLATTLNQAGYLTASVGEMPFAPTHWTGGLQQIVAAGAEYDAFLESEGWAGKKISEQRRQLLREKREQSNAQFQAAADPWPAELDETAFWSRKAMEFLSANRDRDFFLHINFRRPHHPFDPPTPYDRMYSDTDFPPSYKRDGEMDNKPPQQQKAIRDSVGFDLSKMSEADLRRVKSYYYGMISLNDHYIGQVLDHLKSLGLADNTVVVFNADHGEMLGDHGLLFKGAYFYDGVVHTGLVIRAPGKVPAGLRVKDMVQEIDVLQTVLRLLGVDAPPGVQGRSLGPLFNADKLPRRPVFSEFPTIKMARTEDWKLVHYVNAPHGELYNLREDPHELTNIYADPKAAAARAEMEHLMTDWFVQSHDPLLQPLLAEEVR